MNRQFSKGITERVRLSVKSYPEIPSDKGKWEESAGVFVHEHSYVNGNNHAPQGGLMGVWEEGSHHINVDESYGDERKEYRYRWMILIQRHTWQDLENQSHLK